MPRTISSRWQRKIRFTPGPARAAFVAGILCALLLCGYRPASAEDKAAGKTSYDEHMQPILQKRCFACHNTSKKSGGLDMTTYTALMQGGSSGAVIEPGSPGDSYLYMLVSHQSEPFMPPKSDKLPDDVLAVISKWIEGGALENSGSKPLASKKPKFDFALKAAPTGRPEGPPPLPGRLSLEPVLHTDRSNAITALATSPWAPLVAVGSQKQVLLYHTGTLQLVGALPFPEGLPHVLKFSSTGELLLAGGGHDAESGRAVVWNVRTGERIFEVGNELDAVLAADISADQTMIALGGPQKIVRIYSTLDGKLLNELKKHTDWIYSISFSPDGVLLATGDRNGGLMVWEAYTAREYLTLNAHTAGITGLAWRVDSNLLASSSEDGTVRLWEMENGGNVKGWTAHGPGATAVEFTREGNLVSCGRDKVTRLWDQNGAQQREFPALADIALKVTYCDETKRVITGDWSGEIRVWNAADGAQIGTLTTNPQKLAQLLDAATQLIPPRQAEAKKTAAAGQAAQAALVKLQADLDGVNKTVQQTQAQMDAANKTATETNAAITKQTADVDAATKAIATLEPVVGPLKEAFEKAQLASSKAANDKELAAATDTLKKQFEAKSATLAAEKKKQTETTAALGKSKEQLAAAQKQAADAKTALEAAQKQVQPLTDQVKAATATAASTKQAADAAAKLLDDALVAQARWSNEIEYVKRLGVLAEKRTQYDQLAAALQTAQAERDKAQGELNAANQAVQAAQKAADEAVPAAKKAKEAVDKAAADETAAAQLITTIDGVIPPLKETQAKAEAAVQKAPNDKDVADANTALKALVQKKVAELAAAQKALEEKKVATAKSKELLTAAEKRIPETAAALEAAKKGAAQKTDVLKPFADKFAQATAAADEAKKHVDAAQAALNMPFDPAKALAEARSGKQSG